MFAWILFIKAKPFGIYQPVNWYLRKERERERKKSVNRKPFANSTSSISSSKCTKILLEYVSLTQIIQKNNNEERKKDKHQDLQTHISKHHHISCVKGIIANENRVFSFFHLFAFLLLLLLIASISSYFFLLLTKCQFVHCVWH